MTLSTDRGALQHTTCTTKAESGQAVARRRLVTKLEPRTRECEKPALRRRAGFSPKA